MCVFWRHFSLLRPLSFIKPAVNFCPPSPYQTASRGRPVLLPNSLISSDERETETTGDSAAVIGGCSRVSRSPSWCSGSGAPCSGWPAPPPSRLIRDHKLANINTYINFFFFPNTGVLSWRPHQAPTHNRGGFNCLFRGRRK